LDFGIAKLAGDESGELGAITGPGTMLGTPCYMAPEQAFGERDIDHRADIWSLGVMLYEALAGKRPVDGENLGQVLRQIMSAGVTPLEQHVPDLPAAISGLVSRMLAQQRAERPSDLREVYRTLALFTKTKAPAFEAPAPNSAGNSDPPSARDAQLPATLVSVTSPAKAGTTVDPGAPTEQATPAETPASSSARTTLSGRRRELLYAVFAAMALAGALIWRFTRPAPEIHPLPFARASAPRVRADNELSRPPAPATSEPAPRSPSSSVATLTSAPSPSATSSSALVGRPHKAPAIRAAERERPVGVALSSSAAGLGTASATASPPANTEAKLPSLPSTAPATEGLHEEPPF
jgi:serine/threonine-protein kinase